MDIFLRRWRWCFAGRYYWICLLEREKVEICADVCLHLLQVVIFICIVHFYMLVSEMNLDVSYILK